MERSRRLVPLAVLLIVVGSADLSRFASGVRSVAVVGLAGGGFALGMGVGFLVMTIVKARRPDATR